MNLKKKSSGKRHFNQKNFKNDCNTLKNRAISTVQLDKKLNKPPKRSFDGDIYNKYKYRLIELANLFSKSTSINSK